MNLTELQSLSDEKLMQALQTGGPGSMDAFDTLFQRYKTPLLSFLSRYTRDQQKAEDLFQQVFLKVWQNAGSFAGNSAFRTWMFSIAVNAARDLFRHEKVRRNVSMELTVSEGADGEGRGQLEPASQGPDPQDLVAGAELEVHLQRALVELEDDYRAPFVLARVNGLSYQEIAEALELTVPTVRMRIHRAHKKLAASLQKFVTTEESRP
ncbi:MAG: RNA polymerase sigma factor [Planctomycetota bacterium]